MMRALRFFCTVRLHSNYMLGGMAVLGMIGVVEVAASPERGIDAAVPLLLLHMFGVSSGFAVPARRGHFDLLLTGGTSRLEIAAAHWIVSVAPGLIAWFTLGLCEALLWSAQPGAVFASGTVAAVALISSLGWAVTVPLPRLSGGAIWLFALVVVLTSAGYGRAGLLTAAQGGGGSWSLGSMFVLCPLLLAGMRLEAGQFWALVPGLAFGLTSALAAAVWVVRVNLGLEASQ